MPASQTGFGDLILGRNISLAPGCHVSVLGCPPGLQAPPHLPAVAGLPLTYQGYSFIPFPHSRHMGHLTSYDLKAPSSYQQALMARSGSFFSPYRPASAEEPGRLGKAASRESTGALKAWLKEHLKNPYPTKGEKIMLAIVTKMSLTQVSTWFANARRRLKKENRVSWASKGKSDEEEEEGDESEGETSLHKEHCEDETDPQATDHKSQVGGSGADVAPQAMDGIFIPQLEDGAEENEEMNEETDEKKGCGKSTLECKETPDVHKAKIWSLAETATSDTGRRSCESRSSGEWWAEWASRNGRYLPMWWSAHDLLQQSGVDA